MDESILKINPRPIPNIAPPTSADKSKSVKGGRDEKVKFQSSIKSEETTVAYTVEIVNFFPKNIAPTMRSGTLITIIRIPVRLVSMFNPLITFPFKTLLITVAIPVTPPGAILFGSRNTATPKE